MVARTSAPRALLALALLLILVVSPDAAQAYIGPGAGFAFLGSTFVFVVTIVLALTTLLLWPVRLVWRRMSKKGIPAAARTRRVVVLGLDGLDPNLLERFSAEGALPNVTSLMQGGAYSRLKTTLPALSPVAWSTFQTGVNPGAHNIFDFLTRDKRHCLPLLSSTEIVPGVARRLFGKLTLSRAKPSIRIMRKSQPFWKVLGKHGIFSNIIRVPISYPPEKFGGNILSAMCTPDLRGTQGTFALYTTRRHQGSLGTDGATGGEIHLLTRDGSTLRGELAGPPDTRPDSGPLTVAFTLSPTEGGAILAIQDERERLRLNEFSRWVPVTFVVGRRKKVSGICRFCLREVGDEVTLYVSPLNAHPERPVFPIAHPIFFASWLAKQQGLYGTLGLMEDTWGRNELALDDERFLAQAYLTHEERERMFFEALDRTREGVCACVFDASDRIQHMFWRYLDPLHPSPREDARFDDVIPEMYRKMDALVGKTRARLRDGDVLIVLSDHGFASFRRGVNLNTWLLQNGYMVLKEGKAAGGDYFRDVEWSRTRAFAVGLSGLYVNQKGRESQGIVPPAEAASLKQEIARKLEQLIDPTTTSRAIRKVYDTAQEYRGLYSAEAPDLIVGYEPGYRVSWESITGAAEAEVFSDNRKAWSGDHHVDPEAVPGILLSNRKITAAAPHIRDLAPTILDLFAVPVPSYMEGKVII